MGWETILKLWYVEFNRYAWSKVVVSNYEIF